VINMKTITVECNFDKGMEAPDIIIWKQEEKGKSRVGWHMSINEGMWFLEDLRTALKNALFLERIEEEKRKR